jgi:hypothetical protein
MTSFALPLDQVVCSGAFDSVAATALEFLSRVRAEARPRVARAERVITLERKNYVLLTQDGERIGIIPVPERRPVLGRLQPTLYLRRC